MSHRPRHGRSATGVLSDIPFLDDVFGYFKDKDIVLTVEIKSEKEDFCRIFKDCVERFGAEKNVVVISFYEEQLRTLHTLMPQIPTATLNGISVSELDKCLSAAATYNMRFDLPYSSRIGNLWGGNLKNRGYMAWGYTYDGYIDSWAAAGAGVTGITNNNADSFSDSVRKVLTENIPLAEEEDIRKKNFPIRVLTYSGEEKTVDANVFLSEETEYGYRAILRYEDGDYWRCTGSIALSRDKENPAGGSGKSGCGSAASAGIVFPVVAAMGRRFY